MASDLLPNPLTPRDRSIPPWDRRATATLLAIVVVAGASLAWLVHPWYETRKETFDASMYLLCAKSLLAGQGYTVLDGIPFTVRPPGFSLILAPILAWRGLDFLALNLLVSLFGVAGVACLFVLARARIGILAAACVAVAVWLNPGYQHLCNQVMSDVPGATLLLACLVLERWVSRAPSPRRDALLGAAIALAAYVRSADLLLLPAVIVSRVLLHWSGGGHDAEGQAGSATLPVRIATFVRKRILVITLVPLLLLVPWSLRNAFRHPTWPADQTLLASYSAAMWHADAGDPSSPRLPMTEIVARAPERARDILYDLGSRLRQDQPPAPGWVLGTAMMAALALVAVRRRAAPELYALAATALLAFYFDWNWRLALPLWILGSLALAETAIELLVRFTGDRAARAATAALFVVIGALDFAPRQGWREIETAYREDVDQARAFEARLPAPLRLAAPVGWHWSLLLGRPVYSLVFASFRSGMGGAEAVIQKHAIDAVIFRADPPETPWMIAALQERHGPAERVRSGLVVRMRR